jgi:hypothetical protein
MPKSTQDEPSKENQASRDGEPSTDTQPAASEENTTQAMPGQSSGTELFLNEPNEAGPWNSHNLRSDQNREEVTPGGSISEYRQSLDHTDTVDKEVEEKEEPENSGKS